MAIILVRLGSTPRLLATLSGGIDVLGIGQGEQECGIELILHETKDCAKALEAFNETPAMLAMWREDPGEDVANQDVLAFTPEEYVHV